MRKVFAVGAMQIDEKPNAKRDIVSSRLWNLYLKFEDAEKAVLENHGDLFEYTYNYALIEEVREVVGCPWGLYLIISLK